MGGSLLLRGRDAPSPGSRRDARVSTHYRNVVDDDGAIRRCFDSRTRIAAFSLSAITFAIAPGTRAEPPPVSQQSTTAAALVTRARDVVDRLASGDVAPIVPMLDDTMKTLIDEARLRATSRPSSSKPVRYKGQIAALYRSPWSEPHHLRDVRVRAQPGGRGSGLRRHGANLGPERQARGWCRCVLFTAVLCRSCGLSGRSGHG